MPLETILITLVLLLPPLVLWRCKSFCEKHPSTVPFRTVPLGCLTMLWLILIYGFALHWIYDVLLECNPPHWLNRFHPLPILFAIPLGIAVIVLLSKRFAKGKERPCGYLYPAVFSGALVIALAISFCVTVGSLIFEAGGFGKVPRNWHTIYLPQLQDCRLAFEQRPSHPFLAEYDYRIRLRHGKNLDYFQLWPNTGGQTFVNVYKVADDKYLLKEKDAWYIIDATQRQVYLVDIPTTNTVNPPKTEIRFAVPLSDKSFSSMGGEEEEFHVNFKDGTSAKAIPYDVDLSQMEYLGCIMDYSFYTPDEQPEGEGHSRYPSSK